MFGKKWFTDGVDSKPFIEGEQPSGWRRGNPRAAQFKEENGFCKKKHTEETRKIMSSLKKGKLRIIDKNKKRKFINPEELEKFLSLGYTHKGISYEDRL